jgi:L-asparaginase II
VVADLVEHRAGEEIVSADRCVVPGYFLPAQRVADLSVGGRALPRVSPGMQAARAMRRRMISAGLSDLATDVRRKKGS